MVIKDEHQAQQLVAAIGSDIAMWGEIKLVEACGKDNILDDKHNINSARVWDNISAAMKDELEEGRAFFKSRVDSKLFASGMYDDEVKRILIGSKKHVVERRALKLGCKSLTWD
jgi:hypothetical protein